MTLQHEAMMESTLTLDELVAQLRCALEVCERANQRQDEAVERADKSAVEVRRLRAAVKEHFAKLYDEALSGIPTSNPLRGY